MGASINIAHKLRPAGAIGRGGAAQTIPTPGLAVIQFDTVCQGFSSAIADLVNHRLVPTRKGLYLVVMSLTVTGLAPGDKVEVQVRSITEIKAKYFTVVQPALTTDLITITKSVICCFQPDYDEYLEVQMEHNGAGTVQVVGTAQGEQIQGYSSLQAIRLCFTAWAPPV